MPWSEVKKEMIEKGLDSISADRIGEYVKQKGAQLFEGSSVLLLILR